MGIVLALMSLFLISCSGDPAAGRNPQDTEAILREVQTGTRGVEISVVPNYPPATLYDQNQFIALVEVNNRGNHDLDLQDCFIQMTGFDSNIIKGVQPIHSCAENLGKLEGKNVYNTEGGFNQIEFSSSDVSLPSGVFDYSPRLNFLACYNYHTRTSPLICVDPLLFQVTAEQKSCAPRDVGMGGGQGAPVGVSYVGVDMVGSKAVFEIDVQNFGSGRVLSPDADIKNCGQIALQYTDLDKVVYNVELSGGSLIDCKPLDRIVRLNNNRGKIVCSFDIQGGAAFETPLLVNLDYGYIQSFVKPVKIIQTPQ